MTSLEFLKKHREIHGLCVNKNDEYSINYAKAIDDAIEAIEFMENYHKNEVNANDTRAKS